MDKKDIISRQAAIEAAMQDVSHIRTHEFNAGATRAANRIKQLPLAEPKIIRCKDCKWNRTENRKETTQWLPCRALVTPDDFSCIYAERREVTT